MDFSNFKTIAIDGQEVKQLAINGDVVWVKPSETVPASISLSVDNPVIMTGETATISASVLDSDGNPCPNVSVSFSCDIPNGSEYQTITNSNGIAQMVYNSQSIGDVTFTASINSLNDSLTVEDCALFDDCDGTKSNLYNCTMSYTTVSGYPCMKNNTTGSVKSLGLSEFEMSFKMYATGTYYSRLLNIGADVNNGYLVGFDETNKRMRIYVRNNDSNTVSQSKDNAYSLNTWIDVTITVTSDNISITAGENTLTVTNTRIIDYIGFYDGGANRTNYIRDLKIKPISST